MTNLILINTSALSEVFTTFILEDDLTDEGGLSLSSIGNRYNLDTTKEVQ